jgi:DNA-binding protein HU-beta
LRIRFIVGLIPGVGWVHGAYRLPETLILSPFSRGYLAGNRIKSAQNATFPQRIALLCAGNKQICKSLKEEFMASGMTKTQLTRHLAEKLESNNKTAAAFLEHLADTAIKETKKNGVFVVPGLGRLVKAHRKARMGRNPQTGEPIQIKAKTVVKFRVAKAAKDAIAPKK